VGLNPGRDCCSRNVRGRGKSGERGGREEGERGGERESGRWSWRGVSEVFFSVLRGVDAEFREAMCASVSQQHFYLFISVSVIFFVYSCENEV